MESAYLNTMSFAGSETMDGPAASWPQLQFDAANSGNADTSGPAKPLHTAWRFQSVGEYGCASAPAMADDTLYFVSNDTGDGGTADGGYSGIVHAVDASGTERWRTRTTVAQSSPAVADGNVFVAGRGGPLLALDASTGDQRWSFGDASTFEGSPTVADGTVFLATSASDDGLVFALNAADGTVKWSAGADVPGSPMEVTAVAVANDVAYFGVGTDASEGALYAVDAETGDRRWRVDFPRVGRHPGNLAPPTIGNGRVFFATNNALFAFGSDGTEQWREEIRGFTPRFYTEQSPAVADGAVFFLDGDGLIAVDAATGGRLWQFDPSSVTVSSSPVVADGTLYVGTEQAGMYALDATTGDPVGQCRPRPDARVITPPAVVDGTAYVGAFSRTGNAALGVTALETGRDATASAEPTASFAVVPDEILREMPVQFENQSDAFGDFDAEADDVEYRWDFDGDGAVEQTTMNKDRPLEYTYEESGRHEVTLTVRNSYGWTVSTTKSVEVAEERYEPPTARIETEPPNADEKTLEAGDTVILDASASSNGSRDIVSYEWTTDSCETSAGERISVGLHEPCGEWRVRLTVTDELGVSTETSIVLTTGT
ncbi:PQQ-binding-like beta-propeller repeat protein [Natrinema caseinilyticum]|uniref:outer membrane protein assembly factor BamB family protein n=1 Tax=Natrinema caseinilyticum TaxID=2961570 RepID=UPI0020C36B03|nr:PQQ-binding-like beta-propeller repeat protein [Natrinema caseinilyticum]